MAPKRVNTPASVLVCLCPARCYVVGLVNCRESGLWVVAIATGRDESIALLAELRTWVLLAVALPVVSSLEKWPGAAGIDLLIGGCVGICDLLLHPRAVRLPEVKKLPKEAMGNLLRATKRHTKNIQHTTVGYTEPCFHSVS